MRILYARDVDADDATIVATCAVVLAMFLTGALLTIVFIVTCGSPLLRMLPLSLWPCAYLLLYFMATGHRVKIVIGVR